MPNDYAENNDGSLAAAAQVMPDIEIVQEENAQPRLDNGQWTEKQLQAKEAKAQANAARNDRPAVEPEVDPDEDVSALDDEEYFEFAPAVAGQKPTRLKASEVVAGYHERDELRAELAKARQEAPIPEEYEQVLVENVRARQQMMQEMRILAEMLQPMQPNPDLINADSPNYDPGMFQRQLAMSQGKAHQVNQIRQQLNAYEQQQQAEQSVISRARHARERSKVMEFWPETKDASAASKIQQEALQYFGKYGFTTDAFNRYDRSYDYAILQAALAHHKSLASRAAAVKVVRAKPKLVRGSARTATPSSRNAAQGFQQLQQSGSVEDAMKALDGLF